MSDGLKVLLGVLGGAVLVLLLISVFGGGSMMGGMGSMMSGSMMGGGLFGGLFMLLFWVLVIALIVALVVWIVNVERSSMTTFSPSPNVGNRTPSRFMPSGE
jgi:uncharacterized membrane protein